jgi:glycosyltransferase involved in cell wall biosynthesis
MMALPRLRVLQIIPQLVTGGAETMMVRLAASLDSNVFETRAVSLFRAIGSDLERTLDAAGVRVDYLNKRRGIDPVLFLRLRRILRDFAPDVVHTHLTALAHALPALAWRRPAAVFHTVHNVADKEVSPACQRIHGAAFTFGVRPVAIADAVEESVRRIYGIDDALLIPNGVPVDRFQRSATRASAWRSKHGFAEEALLFVAAGRLTAQKNHQLLISAFKRAFAAAAGCHLIIVGDGELQAALSEAVVSNGLTGRVHLLGKRDDMPDVFGAADVFVLPSDWEGHPLTAMEAMAAGLPVIATRVGGVPEIVRDGVTGVLFDAGDALALTNALRSLADEPATRSAMSRAAVADSKRFDVRAMARAYQDAYLHAVTAHRGQSIEIHDSVHERPSDERRSA